ncbi:hypothetical protein J2X36_003982 [Methylobacterium sp. BE186]|uniref:hypothetical protein n=1 Tax=Methylobacterium sp. BE186 TaxID=2817715 RepID=UPI00285E012D|nr:hypothetical protein [Methylobacterium sp. BE186]MDR7039209.1 hypothetical protein [Methylobacterium sp. BE186]
MRQAADVLRDRLRTSRKLRLGHSRRAEIRQSRDFLAAERYADEMKSIPALAFAGVHRP